MSKDIDEILVDYRRTTDMYYSEYEDKVITLEEWSAVRDRIQEKAKQAIEAEITKARIEARKSQLDEDMLKWHDSDDGEYAMYFKDKGELLLEQLKGDSND